MTLNRPCHTGCMGRRRIVLWVLLGLVVGLIAVWTVVGWLPTRGIETPEFAVLKRGRGYEVREYAPMVLAQVSVQGGYLETQNNGFMKVADYIFGNNTRKDKIAMTAPVLHAKESQASETISMTAPVLHQRSPSDDAYLISFVMPKGSTTASLPTPNNAEVSLKEIPARRMAVLRFGGYATQGRVRKKTALLLERLKKDGISPVAEPSVAQYNPPWTPPYMRRNEILVELSPEALK